MPPSSYHAIRDRTFQTLIYVSVFKKGTTKIEGRKGTQEIVFDLKADGDRLTGTVATGRRMRAVTIQDGKIEGDQLSFTTVTKGRKQENKLLWTARVSEKELKGSSRRESRGRERPFTAVRQ